MAVNPKRRLSLDTNVLLEMAAEREVALEFHETFQAMGYELVIAPRVVAELRWLEIHGSMPESQLAALALSKLSDGNIKPFDLSGVSLTVARQFAETLIRKQLLPDSELGDGRILGETAVAGVSVLVTFDKHLLDLDDNELRLALDEADLTMVNIAHPGRLLRALR